MSSPASATDAGLQARVADLRAAGSLEISPRELHRAGEVAALLPADTCVYIPSLPGLPLARTLETVGALREAGLDPVPHVSARRILDREEFEAFVRQAVSRYGVHRVLLLGGDEPRPKGPFADSLELLGTGLLAECGIREIGVAGYPEGHPRIAPAVLKAAFERKLALAREQRLGAYVVTQFSFDAEAKALYDAEPPHFDAAHFEAILADIAALLPGDAPRETRPHNRREFDLSHV